MKKCVKGLKSAKSKEWTSDENEHHRQTKYESEAKWTSTISGKRRRKWWSGNGIIRVSGTLVLAYHLSPLLTKV